MGMTCWTRSSVLWEYGKGQEERVLKMGTATVSPKYEVVIPEDVRDSLRIQPGAKMRLFAYGDRIEMIPVRDIRELRGFLKGMDTTLERDEDRV